MAPQAEIWLGRFSGDFTAIEAWARVTSNAGGDSYPGRLDRSRAQPASDAGERPRRARRAPRRRAPSAAPDRVVVEARVVSAGAVPTPESIAPYRHALVVNRYEIVNVVEGSQADKRSRCGTVGDSRRAGP